MMYKTKERYRNFLLGMSVSVILLIAVLSGVYEAFDPTQKTHSVIKIILSIFSGGLFYFSLKLFIDGVVNNVLLVFGGLFFSILIYFLTPDRPKHQDIEVSQIKGVYFLPYSQTKEVNIKKSLTYMILPLQYKAKNPKARIATLKKEEVMLSISGESYDAEWLKFVESSDLEIKEVSDARGKSIPPGEVVNHETLFIDRDTLWIDFIEKLSNANSEVVVTVESQIDSKVEKNICKFDANKVKSMTHKENGFLVYCEGYVHD